MADSANKIIHITRDFNSLKNIIATRSLRLSYCKENFYANNRNISLAVHPMVCFSEYNIDEINSKKITYGRHAVGFSKKWARKNKIGPVLYVSQSSLAAKGMKTLLEARQGKCSSKLPSNLRLPIMELKCFIKNEQGHNRHYKKDNYDFKSENEWRYVPEKSKINGNLISQNQSVYMKDINGYNEKLLEFPLRFEIRDIEVLFVLNESEAELCLEYGVPRSTIRISKWEWEDSIKINAGPTD